MLKQTKLEPEEEVTMIEQLDLKSAQNIAETVVIQVKVHCKEIDVVGSIRRCRPYVHDIDFVVLPKESELCTRDDSWINLRQTVLKVMDAKPVFKHGDQIIRALLALADGKYVQIDFYRCTPNNYGIQKLIRTGSAEHNVFLAKSAIRLGLRLLYSKGLCNGDRVIADTGSNEKDIFYALGLEWIEPSKREMINGKPVWWKQ